MNKFKVGDIVIGNKKANSYWITKQGTIGVVTEIVDNDLIEICVAESPFTVRADSFDIYMPIEHVKFAVGGNPIPLEIKRVIFNDPATIVLWQDGTKTVVKVHDEPFDAEKGLAMAILKKLCGKAQLRMEFKKWITQN